MSWSLVEKAKERVNLVHALLIAVATLGGIVINATLQVADWFMTPFDNQKDITILLEKSEETSTFIESMKNVQSEIKRLTAENEQLNAQIKNGNTEQDEKIAAKLKELSDQLSNMRLELGAQIRRMEDGQLQLFLKTERLDERTSRSR